MLEPEMELETRGRNPQHESQKPRGICPRAGGGSGTHTPKLSATPVPRWVMDIAMGRDHL